jgi:hypothetical protein
MMKFWMVMSLRMMEDLVELIFDCASLIFSSSSAS